VKTHQTARQENLPVSFALHLLGPPKILLDGAELRFPRRKVLALLAYLAVTGQSHSRDELTFLLYPKQDRSQAQSNFRSILSYLHKAIGEEWLVADRSRIALSAAEDIWIDVQEFRRLLNRDRNPDTGAEETAEETLLSNAARLYRGKFLESFYLKDSPPFEEWQSFQQEDFQEGFAFTQRRLLEIYSARGEIDLSLEFGRRLLQLDNLDEAVHRRMMKLYHLAGRRSAALRQYDSCRKLLARELGEAPDEETDKLFEAIQSRRKAPGTEADLETQRLNDDLIPANLPAYLAPFVGREREIADVANLLLQQEVRMLTLTGAGGTGKTRLAVRAAAELRGRFEHGVFFIDLSPLREPAQVIPAVASTLDVRETQGQNRPIVEILKHHLGNKRLLMLLDTFEHLKEAAVEVQGILDACPGCKVLATSREVLPISGKWDYPVPPLSLPEPGAENSTERLACSEAVRLLEARAAAVRPDFQISLENAPAIAEICRRLDGLPLAIELAASRMRILSVQDLVQRLADRFKVLKDGGSGLPARQQTLRRTIDWSYQLLSNKEKRLFVRLGVFSGGCNLEAAEAVCAEPVGETDVDVLAGLISLADKSLVLREEADGETRIRMLDTILGYARLRLGESLEAETVRQIHALFYLKLAETAEPELHGPDQMLWLERLEREHRNLQEALSWFLSTAKVEEALRLGVALTWFWTRYGHTSEGAESFEQAIGLAGADLDPATRARALHALGWLVFLQGYWSRGRLLYLESLELFRSLGDRQGEGMALADLGVAERWLGEVEAGTRHVEEAVRIAREQGEPLRLAITLIWAYSTTGGQFTGEAPEAELKEAWELSRKVGDLWCMAHSHQGLGDLLGERGEYLKARWHHTAALKAFRKLKDRWLIAWTLQGLGRVSYLAGEYRHAQHYFRKGVQLFDALGDRGGVAIGLGALGMVFRALGQHLRAACILGASLSIQDDLIGREATSRIKPNPELLAAQEEYQAEHPTEWAQGVDMDYQQAIEYARRFSSGGSHL
jgi:predicted ATPase/DNA-binding SARP family transcriptional activator